MTTESILVPAGTVVSAKGDGAAVDVSGASSERFWSRLDHKNHRAGIARPERLWFGRWRDLGSEVHRCVSTEVLFRRVSAASGSERALRCEIRSRALGSRAVGTRHRDSDVRVRRDAEGNSCRHFARSQGRSEGARVGKSPLLFVIPDCCAKTNQQFRHFHPLY